MKLAYVSLAGRGATDALIAAALAQPALAGRRLAGTLPVDTGRALSHPCDMDLQILPDGPILRISQDLGSGSRGCRLDHGALEEAVVEVDRRLDGAQALVVNKWGKVDSEGRGFVPLIARALEAGMPVLVGVNGLNLPAFLEFAGGLAVELPADPLAVAAWLSDAMAAAQAASRAA